MDPKNNPTAKPALHVMLRSCMSSTGDDEAARLFTRGYRAGYGLPELG